MHRGHGASDLNLTRIYIYRLRSILRQRWSDYLVLAVLVGVIGGVAMGSVVAGRRTQSSFAAFLRQDDASTLTMSTYGVGGGSNASFYSPALEAAIRQLPQVQEVESWTGTSAVPIQPDGAPYVADYNTVNIAASVDGVFFHEDRVTVINGKMADPTAPDQFMTSAAGAQLLGVRVGQTITFGVYDPSQLAAPGFGTPAVQPKKRIAVRLVGIVEFNNQIIQDDTDRLPANLVLTPAFSRLLATDQTNGTWFAIKLKPGIRNIGAVEQQLVNLLPTGSAANFNSASTNEQKVESALRPESIALGVFGLIAALAALGICVPMMARLVVSSGDDRRVLRELGAAPSVVAADSYIGTLASLVAGTLLACILSVALASLAPLGPVRNVYHPDSLKYDWTVTLIGVAFFTGVLGLIAVYLAFRQSPHRIASREHAQAPPPSRIADVAASAGLPSPLVVGMRFAFEPGSGRTAVPARWVQAGAMLSVALVAATLTFASGLRTLVSHPALYGWNWSYALTSGSDVPPQALAALSNDREVQAWSGYSGENVEIDGQTVPILGAYDTVAVAPPILTGHEIAAAGQIVLGQSTLAALGKRVGDEVEVGYGSPSTAPLYLPPQKMKIVGTATFPAIGGSNTFSLHTTMGIGALFSYQSLPPSFVRQTQNGDPIQDGPPLVFIRYQPGVSSGSAVADLRRIIGIAAKAFAADPKATFDSVSFVQVQRPAAIVNYQSTGNTPLILASGLALGTMVALALSLMASVRRKRRDLAVLKTLGFVRRQLILAVTVQALVTAVLADAVGIPVGIAAGRQMWIAFARSIDAVPAPTVPLSMLLVVAASVLVGLVVAFVPGRVAARTPAAAVLHAE